jgi:hopanoid biosynthesis associated protein HpnK
MAGRRRRRAQPARGDALKRIILSADDFGIAPEVNEAVEIAHTTGLLRAASLMVGAPAFDDAVARARRLPSLAVGLHVVLVNGRPVLPPREIPDLVDSSGAFLCDLVRAGFRFFFRPHVRAQLAAEIRAQFERYAATGLNLDHVDAQSHMHVHPTVFRIILDVGRDYGLRAIRIPREPFGATRSIAPWLLLMRLRAQRAGLKTNDYALGLNAAGAMTERRVAEMIERLPDGVTEIFFHPATGAFAHADEGTERYQWRGELDALTSSTLRAAIERRGIESVVYGELQ